MEKKISSISKEILSVLKSAGTGLSIHEIRTNLKLGEVHQHLDRRLRELDQYYEIGRQRRGAETLYIYKGDKKIENQTNASVSQTVRAKVLNRAAGRCQMCGRTIKDDEVRLHVDHKIPQSWGGSKEADNLWAICSTCNEGKKNYFATFDHEIMKGVLGFSSVHQRIAELLRTMNRKWVDCDLIEFVANSQSYQTDWRRRLRELRDQGLDIETRNRRKGRRTISEYRLVGDVNARPLTPGRRRVRERLDQALSRDPKSRKQE